MSTKNSAFLSRTATLINLAQQRIQQAPRVVREGRVVRATGLVLEAVGMNLPVGAACQIYTPHAEQTWSDAEVVGFDNGLTYLMPLQPLSNIEPGAKIRVLDTQPEPLLSVLRSGQSSVPDNTPARALPVGHHLLGRVVDGTGQPLDEHGPFVEIGRAQSELQSRGHLVCRP